MTIQVLVATMDQKPGDYSLLDKMNIQTDAIICNQCDRYEVAEFQYRGHHIKWMSFAERGVGLNRNNGLMRATAEICILADDDMVFVDGYGDLVCGCFQDHPACGVIAFDLIDESGRYDRAKVEKKITKRNFGQYGAARIAFRNDIIKLHGISFNTMFGGGCKYSSGEDSLFLVHCLDKKIPALSVPIATAAIYNDRASTWFSGHNDKYFFDRGVFYYVMDRRLCYPLAFYHCLRHRKTFAKYGWYRGWKQMCNGIKSVKRL